MIRRTLAALILAAALAVSGFVFTAPTKAVTASGCCEQLSVSNNGPYSPYAYVCLYGYNQNWSVTEICNWIANGSYINYSNYWWQTGCCESGTNYGFVDVISCYDTNCTTDYWENVTVTSCSGYWDSSVTDAGYSPHATQCGQY